MQVKSIGLMVHPGRADGLEKAGAALRCFKDAGIDVFVEKWVAEGLKDHLPLIGEGKPQMMVSLGGDGTLLRCAQMAVADGIPLLGVNLGRVGFLTEVEFDALSQAARHLSKGDFLTEKRMLLSAVVNGKPAGLALNDITVSRGGSARLLSMEAYVSDDLIGRYYADGLIISTPTGSTGYSLSAGGPIVSPQVACVIISPICPHSLQMRPAVVSDKELVCLNLQCDHLQGITLSLDGKDVQFLAGNDEICIRRAACDLHLVRLNEPHFFNLVRKKLSQWSC